MCGHLTSMRGAWATGFGFGGNIRAFQRIVEAQACLLAYKDVETGLVSINSRQLRVYRRVDQAAWSTDFEAVVRYARPRQEDREDV